MSKDVQLNSLISEKEYSKAIQLCIENNYSFLYDVLFHSSNSQRPSSINICLVCDWMSSEDLTKLWNRMSFDGNGKWGKLQTVGLDHRNIDYHVVINAPRPFNLQLDPLKTIIFRMEPNMEINKELWGEWGTPKNKGFVVQGHNNIEWHINKTWQYLISDMPIKKFDYCLSTVMSNKYFDPGHVKRIDFLKNFDMKSDVPLHFFGTNTFNWKNYKGSLPACAKDDALFQYKYTFNCENNFIPDYFTEKLVDGILAECLVFYSGCLNVKEYIDERAFIYLDLDNVNESIKIIEKAIEERWWEQRIQYIRKEKKKILNELQFFPRLEKLIDSLR